MSIWIAENEAEIYRGYGSHLMKLPPATVTFSGLDLPVEEQRRISTAIRELLTAETIRREHALLRSQGVDGKLMDDGGLRTSLDDLGLPPEISKELAAKVRMLVPQPRPPKEGDGSTSRQRLPLPDQVLSAEQPLNAGCIKMATGVPGTTQSLSALKPLTQLPATIAVLLMVNDIFGPVWSGDALRLRVESGSQFGIRPDQIQVGLASSVGWAKEIYAWSLVFGKLASVHQNGPNQTPSFMLLEKGCTGADTIVFTKPQFAGVWADVANFDVADFWTVFAGTKMTFIWIRD
jgi:hypothetical protein